MFAWKENELNEEQEAAVRMPGNVLVVACPGSGKTRALTYKIALELSNLKTNKQFVIAITYTHRAADEIQERIAGLGVDASQLWIGTIHSFCLEWILKPYGIYHAELARGFRVIDPHEQEKVFERLCEPYKSQNVTRWDCGFYFEESGYVLSSSKTDKHDIIDVVLMNYFDYLSEHRLIDFELILHYAFELIRDRPPISVMFSRIFPLILVDEYQDTKQIQYAIIAAILKAGKGMTKTFIVGDPNQAIYRSFGGYPIKADDFRIMAGIELTELELAKNYRSSGRIVEYFGNFNLYETNIEAASHEKDYPSIISFDRSVSRDGLESELVRLIRFNIETVGIAPSEVCILAPQWVQLASMTRRLVGSLPEYQFDGPGMVPFSRNVDNFWYKLSRIVLTDASPSMYMRRLRWAGEILSDLKDAGIDISRLTNKSLLRECNSVGIDEADGLTYLRAFFEALFGLLRIDFRHFPVLLEHHDAFFESSEARIVRLKQEGAEFIGDIAAFKRVFQSRSGITISTIHGIKGDEYDAVIAYALLEGMVPNFNDPEGDDSAMKLLYVISSRARKNLHLISERKRPRGRYGDEYQPTSKLNYCSFGYDTVP